MVLHMFGWINLRGMFDTSTFDPIDLIRKSFEIQQTIQKLTSKILQFRKLNASEQRIPLRCFEHCMDLADPYHGLLHEAVKNNDQPLVTIIATKYPDLLTQNNNQGQIPITIAENDNNWDMVLHICRLSTKNAPVYNYNKTLKKALECWQQEKADKRVLLQCIKILMTFPINAKTENIPESEGNTCLHLACMDSRDPTLVLELLDRNCSTSWQKNQAGKIPLEVAADAKDFLTVQAMCSHIDNRYGDQKKLIRSVALFKAVQALQPGSENGVLLKLIDDLLQHDIDINLVTIALAKEKGYQDLAQKLLEKGQQHYKQACLEEKKQRYMTEEPQTRATPPTAQPKKQGTPDSIFFLPPKQPRQAIPAHSVKPANQNWETKKKHLQKFIAEYNATHSWLNPGPKESQDLVAQLKQVVDTVKDKDIAYANIENILRTFFHTRYVIGNFAETPTITQLKNCKIIKAKTIDNMQKRYGALINLFNAFDSQTFSAADSDNLMNDLKNILATFNKIPLKEQYKTIRNRCDEYLISRITSGKTQKTDTILLLQRYIGITDADIQVIQEQHHKEYDHKELYDLPGAGDFVVVVPRTPK